MDGRPLEIRARRLSIDERPLNSGFSNEKQASRQEWSQMGWNGTKRAGLGSQPWNVVGGGARGRQNQMKRGEAGRSRARAGGRVRTQMRACR